MLMAKLWVVGFGRLSGRGGVPGKRKSWSDLARRTQGVGGFKGYRLCRRALRELVLVDFALSVSIASAVSTMSL